MLLGLASSLCFAAATLINKRFKPSVDSWVLTFWQMLIGGCALLAVAVSLGEHWPQELAWSDWACFWWLTIPASTGSFGLWFLALQGAGATQASGFLFLAPVFAVLLSHLLLSEALTLLQATGAFLVLAALWLLNYKDPNGPVRASSGLGGRTSLARDRRRRWLSRRRPRGWLSDERRLAHRSACALRGYRRRNRSANPEESPVQSAIR